MLIVDDEPRVLRYLVKLFRSTPVLDLCVHEAKSVREAVAVLDSRPIDIILTDYRMPGRTGLDLLDHARSLRPDIQVVVLSAYREFDYIYAATGHGAVRYLLKTEDDDTIVETVRELIASREGEVASSDSLAPYSTEVLAYIDRCAEVRRYLSTGDPPRRTEFDIRRPVMVAVAGRATTGESDSDRLILLAHVQRLTDDFLPDPWVGLVLDAPNGFMYWALQESGSLHETPRIEPLRTALRSVAAEAARRHGIELDPAIAERPSEWARLSATAELLFVRTTEASTLGHSPQAGVNAQRRDNSDTESECDDLIVRVKSYVLTHTAADLSLEAIATAVHYSPHYVSRTFALRTGTSLSAYIESVRVDRACSLLRCTDERIADVAAQCGYSSPKYFASVFRRATGMAPNEFRAHERSVPNSSY